METTNMTTHSSIDAPGMAISNDSTYAYLPIEYTKEDVQIIRELALQLMEYASLPVQQEKAKMWAKLNDLEYTRPMVWHNELPWHEINVDDELTLKSSTPFAQRIEDELRRRIYLWRHMPGDMVIEPVFYSPMIIDNSGIGMEITEETAVTDANNEIVGHKFIPQIKCEDDLERIVTPKVTLFEKETKDTYEAYKDILGDIIPVEVKGPQGFWYAPIDDVVQLMGTNELLMNLTLDPDLVHASMKKICDAYMGALDQYENLGCLGSNNLNYRIGAGAYGYTSELTKRQASGMKCCDMWGASASQFFTSVSPEMQDEFSIRYEKAWLERFALSYYGCCERLDKKIDVLSQVRGLRKISCSPWSNTANMGEMVGRKFVVSLKPSPAYFAFPTFDEDAVRQDVSSKLDALKDNNVEIIIKDVSTVRYDPYRLWKWVEIVTELCESRG